MKRRFALAAGIIFLTFAPCLESVAQDAAWQVKDASYRATLKLKESPSDSDTGVEIKLPEFGQTRPDLTDVLLADAKGQAQPLAAVWRGQGQWVLLLAKELKAGANYYVYFGGKSSHVAQGWTPKISLLMETRRLPENAKFDSWPEMKKTWQTASEVDGAGFVRSIYQGGNPFGESANFVTHYTGWLRTTGLKEVVLYTLSSDASFVLVNDQFAFDWPGIHSPRADLNSFHNKKVTCSGDFTKIDYYHAKLGGDQPATVLGWQLDGKTEAIPPDAWLHPGVSEIQKIEEAHGWPVPIVNVKADSYIGYGGQWFFEARFFLKAALPQGWSAEWRFADGAIFSGAECRRVIVGTKPQTVTVKLQRGSDETRGVNRFHFPDDVREASIRNAGDVARYLDLLALETPAQLSLETLAADLVLLNDFGTEAQIAKFAEAWLQKNPDPANPLWLSAQLARLRALAQSDARQALDQLRRINPQARKQFARQFDLLELELLVFYLRDASAEEVVRRVGFQYPNNDAAMLAKVRLGDLYRLLNRYKQAIQQYESIQKQIVDESAGRKLPAQDQAYSITIKQLLNREHRREAAEKLQQWELRHPMAKFDSDFLLLRGRALNAFGRWAESLAELDSFKKIQPDSPYLIDADFYRAEALFALGKKEEARKIWNSIATNYPKHELAGRSRELAGKQ